MKQDAKLPTDSVTLHFYKYILICIYEGHPETTMKVTNKMHYIKVK